MVAWVFRKAWYAKVMGSCPSTRRVRLSRTPRVRGHPMTLVCKAVLRRIITVRWARWGFGRHGAKAGHDEDAADWVIIVRSFIGHGILVAWGEAGFTTRRGDCYHAHRTGMVAWVFRKAWYTKVMGSCPSTRRVRLSRTLRVGGHPMTLVCKAVLRRIITVRWARWGFGRRGAKAWTR